MCVCAHFVFHKLNTKLHGHGQLADGLTILCVHVCGTDVNMKGDIQLYCDAFMHMDEM